MGILFKGAQMAMEKPKCVQLLMKVFVVAAVIQYKLQQRFVLEVGLICECGLECTVQQIVKAQK